MEKEEEEVQVDRKKIYFKQQCLQKQINKERNIKSNDDTQKLQKTMIR